MKTIYTTMLLTCLVLAGQAQDPSFEWVIQLGGSSFSNNDYGFSITTDNNGNVYTTGSFSGTADFDPGLGVQNFTALGGNLDMFIQKLDADGNFLWAIQQGEYDEDYGHSITTDVNGNVYIAGIFSGTVDFDPGPNVQNLTSWQGTEMFIQKLDSSGNLLWVIKTDAIPRSIITDASGNVYTTGKFYLTTDFDPGSSVQNLTASGYSGDAFIQKLDANGNFIWAKQMGGSGQDIGNSITIDVSGSIYTTGSFEQTVDFDPGPGVESFTAVGSFTDNAFIQKLDTNGNFIWAKQIGVDNSARGLSITTDTNENVYTTGSFAWTIDFDPGSGIQNLTSAGSTDIFIQKLDTNGNLLWVKQMGGSGEDRGNSITIDISGNAYTTGRFEETTDFDPGSGVQNFTSGGWYDIFVQKLDPDGNFLWAGHMGGSDRNSGSSIATDLNGNVYTTGNFYGTVDFNPGLDVQNLSTIGNYDIFIHKLSQCLPSLSTDMITACNAYTWIDGNTYTMSNNTATFYIPGSATNGCDSLITLNLTINSVSDITISVNGPTISANNSNATYQWVDCDNNYAPITGETSQDFTATINGNYAVELTENGCTEISNCVSITTVGLSENSLKDKFIVYPNPTTGNFAIEFDKIQENLTVRLVNISGQLLEEKNFQNTHLIQLEINHPSGIYILELLDDNGNKAALKLVKE